MKASGGGFRVAVVGASSLLGKELLAVLKERQFPISRLVTPNVIAADEPDLPVLDLSDVLEPVVAETDVGEADLDIVFLAAPLPSGSKKDRTEAEVASRRFWGCWPGWTGRLRDQSTWMARTSPD